MKILINATTINGGGGLQVANSLINEFTKKDVEIVVCCSREVFSCLSDHIKDNIKIYKFEKSPAKFKNRLSVSKKLYLIEDKINPDIVLTVFGPSYWKPRSPHLLGFALAQIAYPSNPFFKRLSWKSKLRFLMEFGYKKNQFKRNAQFFWCETEDVKKNISKYLDIPLDHVFVAGNTCNHSFINPDTGKIDFPQREAREFRFVVPTTYMAHKNLEIIPKVLPLIEHDNVKFFVTLASSDYDRLFSSCTDRVINLGILHPEQCPSAYYHCDALFCPTLLECFTANYPESMMMERPILTSHYSFAKNLCQDAASYFDPFDPEDIAEKIINSNHSNIFELVVEKDKLNIK